ncbi:MAG: HAD family hydrolase [Actinomycetaceae bacterium]|nr:HAD family hydrolase [Actinomycetaceae bacterium]
MSNPLLTPPPTDLPPIPFEDLVSKAAAAFPPDLAPTGPEILIALDVDGTLLTVDGASKIIVDTVERLQRAGVHVVIATGRGIGATLPVLKEVGIHDGWVVASNGALILKIEDGKHTVVHSRYFDPAPIIDQVVKVYPDALIAVEDDTFRYRLSRQFPPNELIEEWDLDDMEGLKSKPVTKLVVRIPGMDRDFFAAEMAKLDLSSVTPAVGWTSWMDVNAADTTKASGLEWLRRELGVPENGTMSIGDGTNDMAMLQWAHHSVAMWGAIDEVRACANALTGPVEYDGAGAVMEALLRRK